MSKKFKVALVQLCSGIDPEQNRIVLREQIRQARDEGADFILTPEVSNAVDRNRNRLRDRIGYQEDDDSVRMLSDLACELDVFLLAGSLALKGNEKLINRSILFDRAGNVQAIYDKMHMFDVDLPGGETYRESNGYQPGASATITDLPWGRLGMTVCYDLRFASVYRALAQAGADFLTVPSAFTRPTGEAHWETLLRARAIETGCYVLAPAQAGDHEDGRKTYGHSMVVAPWGEVLAEGGESAPEIVLAEIDPAAVTQARTKIPALTHDRIFSAPKSAEPMRAAS